MSSKKNPPERVVPEEMAVFIQNRQRKYILEMAEVRAWALQILKMERREKAELSLVFVNNRRIRAYNKAHRKMDRATDVLAFPMLEGPGRGLQPNLLGDVMISLEKTDAEARLYGRSFNQQLRILLIHGILHLLGYDHEGTEDEARRMEVRERTILNHLRAAENG